MSGKRYPEEFKIEAVKQVVDRGHSIFDVAKPLDVTSHSLYAWVKSMVMIQNSIMSWVTRNLKLEGCRRS